MATPQELRAAQILAALQGLGLYNNTLPDLSSKDMGNILEDSFKYSRPGFDEIYDNGLVDYYTANGNTKMLQVFSMIENGEHPLDIIPTLEAQNISFTEGEKESIDKYKAFYDQSSEATAERRFDYGQSAQEYGLSNPNEMFDIPLELAANARALGGNQNYIGATTAQKALLDAQAEYEKRAEDLVPVQRDVKGYFEPGEGVNLAIDAVNYLDRQLFQNSGIGWLSEKLGFERPGIGISEDNKVRETVMVPRKESGGFDWRKKYVDNLQVIANAEQARDKSVQDAMRTRLETQYGTPYEMQLKEIEKKLELERLAREAAARERAARKARGY